MDARMLRELELLPVARLYGFEEQAVAAVREAAPRAVSEAPAEALRMLLVKRRGAEPQRWAVVTEALDAAAAGLLDNMLAAIGVAREGEPVPLAERDLKRLAPAVVVALGPAAAARLLDAESGVASLRGQVHRSDDLPVVVTHGPAQLLARGGDKALAWEDLLLARRAAAGEA
jgi:hypothetical protein